MRDILFRAKRKDNREWVKGMLLSQYGNCYIIDCGKTFIEAIYNQDSVADFIVRVYEVDPETLCQYTGLLDCSGNKIWENDIVRVPMLRGGKTIVSVGFIEWVNGAFSITWKDKEYGRHFAGYIEGITVIGNTFDNADLLKESEDK